MTRIKFCGMTRAEDAARGVELGVDAIGFVLVEKSPRFVTPAVAASLRGTLPSTISSVALFQDAGERFVRDAIALLRPDLLQFHGAETAAYCSAFGLPYLKAVSMRQPQDLAGVAREHSAACALLLDSHSIGGIGGTGETFDWHAVARTDKRIVLAGGLRPDNVAAAIRELRPYAVDVSSGIEVQPGIKDSEKMRAFVAAVRRADQQISE